jgi:hypothetical protein
MCGLILLADEEQKSTTEQLSRAAEHAAGRKSYILFKYHIRTHV